jgi:hypothetical protein
MRETANYAADLIILGLRLIKAIRLRKRSLVAAARISGRKVLPPKLQLHTHGSYSQDAASYWLSLQYGLKPLMSDVYNMCKTISDGINDDVPALSVTVTQDDDPLSPPNLWPGFVATRLDWDSKRGVEVGYRFKISNPTLYKLTQFGLTNPLELAWDLVPLSFAVDWFTGAGAFISSLTHPMGTTFRSGYITTWTDWRLDLEVKGESEVFYEGNLPSLSAQLNNWHRVPLLSFTGQPPYLRIADLGKSRTVSLASLVLTR